MWPKNYLKMQCLLKRPYHVSCHLLLPTNNFHRFELIIKKLSYKVYLGKLLTNIYGHTVPSKVRAEKEFRAFRPPENSIAI